MSEMTGEKAREATLAGLAARYEALIRDLGILRMLEEINPERTPPDEIAAHLVGAIAREDGAEQCSIMFFDPTQGRLILRAVGTRFANQGYAIPKEAWGGKEFSLGEGVAGNVAASRTHIRIDDTETDPRFLPLPESTVRIRSLLCYPLICNDLLLGVLNLSHSQPGFFSPDREHSAWLLAQRASAIINASQLYRMQRLAEPLVSYGDGMPAQDARLLLHAERLHAIGKMVDGVAQGLRSRLTRVIDGLNQVLASEVAEPIHGQLADAHAAGVECGGIVDTLVDYADATTTPYIRGPICIREMVQSAMQLIANHQHPNDTVIVDLPDDLPEVHGDKKQFHQTIVNLCINAIDALAQKRQTIPTGDYRIRLGAEVARCTHTQPGPWGERAVGLYVRLFIVDTGIGMAPELLQQATSPFFTTKTLGTGLGLPMAFHTAQKHGGWLEIHSTPMRGTTINLYFPVQVKSAPSDVPDTPAPCENNGPVVLLVDDEVLIRNMGTAMLKRLGYTTVAAENGEMAVKLLHRSIPPIDVAIIDINMPGMNGYETLRQLRSDFPELPVIMSSGDLQDESVAPQDEAPVGFLQKPYLIATLSEVLEGALKGIQR